MTEESARPAFAAVSEAELIHRECEHGGVGPIEFRRVLTESVFESPVDFLDFTIIPPGSSIGRHFHHGNEELYYVVSGQPLITVNGKSKRCPENSFAVVRHGEWHELLNDTDESVTILVIQVSLRK